MTSDQQDGAQILKGLLDALVLNVLEKDDDYGFGILQKIATQLDGNNTVLRETTLYPLLHRLETKELLESYWKPGDRGTDRKYYRMTPKGLSHMKQRITDWQNVVQILNQTILKPKKEIDKFGLKPTEEE